jgi:hypothetical protein
LIEEKPPLKPFAVRRFCKFAVIREVLSPLALLEGEKQEIRMPITLLFSIGKQLFLIYNQLEQG